MIKVQIELDSSEGLTNSTIPLHNIAPHAVWGICQMLPIKSAEKYMYATNPAEMQNPDVGLLYLCVFCGSDKCLFFVRSFYVQSCMLVIIFFMQQTVSRNIDTFTVVHLLDDHTHYSSVNITIMETMYLLFNHYYWTAASAHPGGEIIHIYTTKQ